MITEATCDRAEKAMAETSRAIGRLSYIAANYEEPDLVAHKWRISEGNATEIYEDWIELCGVAEEWYSYIEENEWPEHLVFPKMYFGDIPEGDIETLNRFIRAWEEKIAHAAGFKDFAGHGNYLVSAASEMGLNLSVEEVE